MRFIYARFKGYIGFNNGMGIPELEIDFSKANHKICIISGRNGGGKSTLLNSLNILPDNSSCYIPNMSAEKELHIIDNDNLYIINISAPVNGNGSRGTTKAYVSKNGVELNPNGNVGTYKETIFAEFELDPSYISLSKLSMDDKGLVGKSPAERKRFFSSIIDSLESYNNMNKVFSKKANIFKSYINNLSSKINNIGDEEMLRNSLSSLDIREKSLKEEKSRLEKSITEAESFIKIVDPNGSIQDRYQFIYNEISNANIKIKELDTIISKLSSNLNISIDDIDKEKNKIEKNITSLEILIQNSNDKRTELLDKKEEDIHVLEIKRQKLSDIKGDFELDTLRYTVDNLRETIKNQEEIFISSGVTNFDVSKDEYIFIFSTLKKIKYSIELFKSNKELSIIQDACSYILNKSVDDLNNDYLEKVSKNIELINRIESIKNDITKYEAQLETMSVLSDRPSNCKIDTCPLIENAVKLSKNKPNKRIQELNIELENIIREQEEVFKNVSYLSNIKDTVKELEDIIRNISSNNLLDKIPISKVFRDTSILLERLCNSNTFNEIEDSDIYIERAEEIENYRSNKELLVSLEADLKIMENKESLINEIANEILTIEESLSDIIEKSDKITKDITFNTNILSDNKIKLESINKIIELRDTKQSLQNTKEELFKEYQSIKSNLEQIKIYLDRINSDSDCINRIENDLQPISEQKKVIDHSLISLDQYCEEYNMYKEKYDIINKLKKYSSPSSEGIQTLFINTYMSKTLSLCNELLSMLFNGEYKLCDYVINSQEFRMPFIGSGMEVDDISSGSSSQVAMMGMIVNFVLLFQASTKYNIVCIDELDEVLDTYNRIMYIQVLNKVIDILGLDQCIIISHSSEVDRSNMDVIQLIEYNETDCYGEGNVIFNYYDYYK